MSEVDDLYRARWFKEGKSRVVDEAIVVVLDSLASQPFNGADFQEKWEHLVELLITEFHNVSSYNLASLGMSLSMGGHHEENLFVLLIMTEASPQSWEHQCFLGHAYRHLKRYELAIPRYMRAYELAIKRAEEIGDQHGCMWLDASDYLYYVAECEFELGRLSEAAVTLAKVLGLLTQANAEDKKDRVYWLLNLNFRRQKMDVVARGISKRLKELRAKK